MEMFSFVHQNSSVLQTDDYEMMIHSDETMNVLRRMGLNDGS